MSDEWRLVATVCSPSLSLDSSWQDSSIGSTELDANLEGHGTLQIVASATASRGCKRVNSSQAGKDGETLAGQGILENFCQMLPSCCHSMTRSVISCSGCRAYGGWPGRSDRIPDAGGSLQVEVAAAPVKEVIRVLKALAKRVDVRDRS